ncbi:MAG: LysR substrate-binding domain-containing protein [Pseudomonadota bacterium]
MAKLIRQLPPLDTLPIFEAAFRLGSFTRAADEVALSQASVSRRIRELEENLGVALFERRRHDVVPTQEGEILAASTHLTLHELASTTHRLRSMGAAGSSFTIYSDISLGAVFVAPLLSGFQQQHPDLKIRVLSSYDPIDSVLEHFDVGLQTHASAEDRFSVEAIADDAVFPVCSPEFAARLPSPMTPQALTKQPLLHMLDVGKGWTDWRDFLRHVGVKRPPAHSGLEFSSCQVCLDMAERGEGIALGWARTIKPKLDDGKLVRIPNMMMRLPQGVFVYRAKTAQHDPVVDAFVAALKTSIEPIPD